MNSEHKVALFSYKNDNKCVIIRFKTLPTTVHHLQKLTNTTFGHCIVDFTIITLGIDAFKFQF